MNNATGNAPVRSLRADANNVLAGAEEINKMVCKLYEVLFGTRELDTAECCEQPICIDEILARANNSLHDSCNILADILGRCLEK